MTDDDRKATQRFTIHAVLTAHCGESLTVGNVEAIAAELLDEVQNGAAAWAFAPCGRNLDKP